MSFEPSPPESDPEDSKLTTNLRPNGSHLKGRNSTGRTINTNFDKTFGWKTWFIIIGVSLTFFALFYGYKLFYVCKLYLNERDLYYTKMENV